MKYFEDFVEGAVQEHSGSYEVTQVEIIEMAERFDPQPFHVDPVAAAASPFGGIVACSAHVFAIACSLASKVGPEDKAKAVSALGFDEMRLHAPVRPGDVLSASSEVLELRASNSRPQLGILRGRGRLHNQDGVEVFSYVSAALIERRDGQAQPS